MLLVKDGNSDEALKFLNSFRTRYPLSPHTPEVELTIGDLHFQRDEYVEAINIYQQFLDLHPTHPRYNYALMQTGKSYMKQVPDTIDRDQSNVRQAIDKFQLLRTDQKFGTEADELTKALKLQLARRDRYVADYYLKRKKWQAAEARLVALVENYAFNDYRDAALYDLVHVNLRLGNRDAAEKRMSELAAAPNADPVVVAKTRALLQSTPPQK